MIGSYGPRAEPYEKTFATSEAPSGMLARGTYSVRSRVVDDDNNVFADWEWAFKVSLFRLLCIDSMLNSLLCRLDLQGLVVYTFWLHHTLVCSGLKSVLIATLSLRS